MRLADLFSNFEIYYNQNSESQRLSIQQSGLLAIKLEVPQDQFIIWTTAGENKYYFYQKPGARTRSGENGVVSELSLVAEEKLPAVEELGSLVIKRGSIKAGDLNALEKEVETFKKVYAGGAKLFCQDGGEDGRLAYFIVMKKIPGVSLDNYFLQNPELNDVARVKILLAVLAALKELHQVHKMIQVDITCKNIHLVEESGEYKAYLLDFGMVCDIPNEECTPNFDLFCLLNELYYSFGYSYIFNEENFLLALKKDADYTTEKMIDRVGKAQSLLSQGALITLPLSEDIIPATHVIACARKYGLALCAFGLCVSASYFLVGGVSVSNPVGWAGLGVGVLSAFILIKVMQMKKVHLTREFSLFFKETPAVVLPCALSELPPLPGEK